ncbi:lipopolysaccharide heptosyltransferase II [candidate division KSB1 bacterium]|nr:lipopolysaccharide heptosyltransferase II [candidate division KSB1 bacterium]
MQKILIIKLRAIGDVLLSTIVISNLRGAYPDAQIDFLTEAPAKDVVAGNPDLNRIIVFDLNKIRSMGFWKGLQENLRFISALRKTRYDMVFDFFGNPRSALLTLMSRAKQRIGYNWRARQLAYNVVVQSRAASVHEAEFHLDALTALGIPIIDGQLHFPIPDAAKNFANQFFEENNLDRAFTVGINASGGWSAKKWLPEYFAELADRLMAELDAKIILLWGPGELPETEKLARLIRHEATIIPETDLKQLGAILEKCSLVVSNDSGPMHIAAAIGTPTVGIFGPTDPKKQGPYGSQHEVAVKKELHCLGCDKLHCESNACMRELSVDDVWQAVQKCIEKNQLRRVRL